MLLKRGFDIVFSLLGLILFLPVMLLFVLLVLVFMSRPVFFRQVRTGRGGRPFTIYKFRTMAGDAAGNTVSVAGDPRITPIGAFMRRYKIDELPELWNVFTGTMSFVGPRPDVAAYTDRLKGEEKRILELRPGITGPATLKYRREEELLAGKADPVAFNDAHIWPDKVRINLDYYYNRTFLTDLRIILRTMLNLKS